MNRRAALVALSIAAMCSSRAHAVTTDFDTFISGRSAASTPLGSGDKVPVVQGGVTKYLAGNIFAQVGVSQTQTNWIINGASNTLTVLAASQLSGTVPTGNGGLGITSFTSGGILYASSSSALASSGVLTANLPVIGGGAGTAPTIGSVTGNTTKFATNTGSITTGHGGSWDSSGNWVDNANAAFGNVALTWTAQQIFGPIRGHHRSVNAGTTDTLDTSGTTTSDCGGTVEYNVTATMTVTAPATGAVDCTIGLVQLGAGRVVPSAASGGTILPNPHGYTGTFSAANAEIFLQLIQNSGGSAAQYLLTGDGQ
jgi:hypothetical protein